MPRRDELGCDLSAWRVCFVDIAEDELIGLVGFYDYFASALRASVNAIRFGRRCGYNGVCLCFLIIDFLNNQ